MRINITQLADLTGLSPFTIRNWERRYPPFKSQRDEFGERTYSITEAYEFEVVAQKVKNGSKISHAIKDEKESNPFNEFEFLAACRERILQSLVQFDTSTARREIFQLQQYIGAEVIIDEVFLSILRELGVLWHDSKITIAQEHFASQFLRHQLQSFFSFYRTSINPNFKVLLATLPGEKHTGGILALSAQLELRGIQTIYLGEEVPVSELVKTQSSLNVDLVALSFTANAPETHLLKELSYSFPNVLIGGRMAAAQESIPNLSLSIGPTRFIAHFTHYFAQQKFAKKADETIEANA